MVTLFGLTSRPGLPCLRAAVGPYLFHWLTWSLPTGWLSVQSKPKHCEGARKPRLRSPPYPATGTAGAGIGLEDVAPDADLDHQRAVGRQMIRARLSEDAPHAGPGRPRRRRGRARARPHIRAGRRPRRFGVT